MVEQLKAYVEQLFQEVPKSSRALDLKEELLANLIERYNDLCGRGVSEQDAYDNAIQSIGDVNELLRDLEKDFPDDRQEREQRRRKNALLTAVSVGLYLVAGIVLIGVGLTRYAEYGLLAALVIALFPTCILIYNACAYPSYEKKEDTFVEEVKQRSSDAEKLHYMRNSLNTIVWMLTVILYFLISFTTMAWYITWVIFLVGVCASSLVDLIFKWRANGVRAMRGSIYTIVWMLTLILYFVISFATQAWYITWVIFLVGVCANTVTNLLLKLKEEGGIAK